MGKSERNSKTRDLNLKTKQGSHTSSSDSDSDSSSSSSADSEKFRKEMKKLKKKIKKEERKTAKRLKKKLKNEKKKHKKSKKVDNTHDIKCPPVVIVKDDNATGEKSCNIPIGLMERSKTMAPMTKEEWEKKQSVIRKVLDEESGRYRLIKGDGEVIEEIVSQKRHKEINKQATLADGAFFQSKTRNK